MAEHDNNIESNPVLSIGLAAVALLGVLGGLLPPALVARMGEQTVAYEERAYSQSPVVHRDSDPGGVAAQGSPTVGGAGGDDTPAVPGPASQGIRSARTSADYPATGRNEVAPDANATNESPVSPPTRGVASDSFVVPPPVAPAWPVVPPLPGYQAAPAWGAFAPPPPYPPAFNPYYFQPYR